MHARLHHDIERWVEGGLIEPDQARAIAEFESSASSSRAGFLAEGLGYVGAALSVGAGILIAQNVWDDLAAAGRLSLIAVLAVAMFGAGWALRTRTVPSLQRLTDVLWAGAVVATGAFAGLFASEVAGLAEESVGIAVGVTAAVVGLVLWAIRRRSLEVVVFYVGLFIAVTAVSSLLFPDGSPLLVGSIIWVLAAAMFAAGHFEWITPRVTAAVLGAIGMAIGSQTLSVEGSIPGSAFATVTAAALVAYAVRRRDDLMLAIGGIMMLIFVPQFLFAVFGDSLGAPVALFVTGVALVFIAISIAKARSSGRDG